MRQRGLDTLISLGYSTLAKVGTHNPKAITMTMFELGETLGIVRTGDDDDADQRADLGVVDEGLQRPLQNGTTTKVLIEFAPQSARRGIARARSGCGDDEGDFHVGKSINGHA